MCVLYGDRFWGSHEGAEMAQICPTEAGCEGNKTQWRGLDPCAIIGVSGSVILSNLPTEGLDFHLENRNNNNDSPCHIGLLG